MENEKIQQKIEEIEKEIQSIPYHKGTEHHIGKLKAKLAKLRSQILEKKSKKKRVGFAIKKEGDATVVLVGLPSVGKSTLLNKLTGAKSKVAAYPFTTLKIIPGMLSHKGAKIQIFDVPGLIKGAAVGKGRGKEVLSVTRVADLLLLMASVENPEAFEVMEKELYLAGVRINEKKPKVFIEKRNRGGIEILGKLKSISKETVKSLAHEFSIFNAKITFGRDVNQDQLIDVFSGNKTYVPALKILSKIDLLPKGKLKEILKKFGKDCFPVSVKENIGLEKLKEEIFKKLKLVRIYLRKSPKAKPEKRPLICKRGITIFEAAEKISEDLAQEIKGAKIKGPSAEYPNQFFGLEHQLSDKDEIFFVKRS